MRTSSRGNRSLVWVFTFNFRQKNKRTKGAFKNLISIQMDLMYIPILQCLHLRCWVLNSPFVGMNISLFLLSFYYRILYSWSLDPWSLPGMTFRRYCAVPWIFTCFKTEEHVWSATSQGKTRINPLGKMRACSQVKREAELLLVKTLREVIALNCNACIVFTCIVCDAFYLHRDGGVIYLQCLHCHSSCVFIIAPCIRDV